MNIPSIHNQKTPITPYVLDFAKFVGIFIVMIGVALSLMHTIAVAAAGNQAPPSSAVVLGARK